MVGDNCVHVVGKLAVYRVVYESAGIIVDEIYVSPPGVRGVKAKIGAAL
jgi:hypothetical protein